MPLSDFETIVSEIQSEFADDSVEFGVFLASSETMLGSRRILWLPTKFTSAISNKRTNDAEQAPILVTDFQVVEAYIVGDTAADACDLRRKLISVQRKLFGPGVAVGDGFWAKEVSAKSNADDFVGAVAGHVIVQRFVWEMDVLDVPDAEYRRVVEQIQVVDTTQITTTSDDVLTPSEQMVIEE